MNRDKFSATAHTYLEFCCPVSEERALRTIDFLDLGPRARAVDYGCGKGAWLRRIARRYGSECIGLDRNEFLSLQSVEQEPNIHYIFGDAAVFTSPADVALCIGSSGIFGGYVSALKEFKTRVLPDGLLLIGEGYWKADPPGRYLQETGIPLDEMTSHFHNVETAKGLGWTELYSATSSVEEWDHYEGMYLYGIERYALDHPGDPDVPEMLVKIRRWRSAYLQWGRDCLGFGLYLFRNDA